jgi:DNA-binding NtrC family response regulator
VVAATHRNLRAKLADGSFREDLYYRLCVVEALVPSLRERKEDIPALVERFLAAHTPPRTLADLPARALPLLSAYDWPGNVRELRNVVTRLLLFPELVEELARPAPTPAAPSPPRAGEEAAPAPPEEDRLGRLLALPLPEAREVVMEEFERRYVGMKLREHGGNISKAADAMGVSRQLVHRLVARYELKAR